MIIDLILDRIDGIDYNPDRFYREVMAYGKIGFSITRAMDNDNEKQVKKALCDYIDRNDYNPIIKNYINRTIWL